MLKFTIVIGFVLQFFGAKYLSYSFTRSLRAWFVFLCCRDVINSVCIFWPVPYWFSYWITTMISLCWLAWIAGTVCEWVEMPIRRNFIHRLPFVVVLVLSLLHFDLTQWKPSEMRSYQDICLTLIAGTLTAALLWSVSSRYFRLALSVLLLAVSLLTGNLLWKYLGYFELYWPLSFATALGMLLTTAAQLPMPLPLSPPASPGRHNGHS
jgi:hypothetical protein